MAGWADITIYLIHYWPRSKGARVIVMSTMKGAANKGHVVSSASGEGMTVDDPEIQNFLTWAKQQYHGARFVEVERPEP